MNDQEYIRELLAREEDGEVIARIARQGQRGMLGGLQKELANCGILFGKKIMDELFFTCKWRHFVQALIILRLKRLPFF